MSLQKEMIDMINTEIGREKFISGLKRYADAVSVHDRPYFLNMSFYFDEFFKSIVPVEKDAITYHAASVKTITILDNLLKDKDCEVLIFSRKLIQFKLDYVKEERKLA